MLAKPNAIIIILTMTLASVGLFGIRCSSSDEDHKTSIDKSTKTKENILSRSEIIQLANKLNNLYFDLSIVAPDGPGYSGTNALISQVKQKLGDQLPRRVKPGDIKIQLSADNNYPVIITNLSSDILEIGFYQWIYLFPGQSITITKGKGAYENPFKDVIEKCFNPEKHADGSITIGGVDLSVNGLDEFSMVLEKTEEEDSYEIAVDRGVEKPAKGLVLHSWYDGNEWHFSLTVGKNSLPDYYDGGNIYSVNGVLGVGSPVNSSRGLDIFKLRLLTLSVGERIYWYRTKTAENGIQYLYPPKEIVDDLKDFCKKYQIDVTITGL